jgi:hypothetical protein
MTVAPGRDGIVGADPTRIPTAFADPMPGHLPATDAASDQAGHEIGAWLWHGYPFLPGRCLPLLGQHGLDLVPHDLINKRRVGEGVGLRLSFRGRPRLDYVVAIGGPVGVKQDFLSRLSAPDLTPQIAGVGEDGPNG